MEISFSTKKPHRALKIIFLIIILMLTAILGSIFISRTYIFYQTIKHGDGLGLALQFDDAFTKSTKPTKEVAAINPQALMRDNGVSLGKGEVTVVQFADFECPFSAKEYSIFRELALKYQNKIKFVFRQLPLTELHPSANTAALASLCANEQGKFWAMHDKLFQNNAKLGNDDVLRYAEQVGVDKNEFILCMETKKYQKQIDQDVADAAALGVRGTPTFFINGQKIEGAIPANIFDTILSSAVQSANTK